MAVFQCKMCGGTIEFEPGATVGVCDSCGTRQTLPRLDSDRKTNLYDRASHFRRNNDYDKAMAIYEQILAEDKTDAESYWSLVLCRYGVEYVEDPATHKRIPTVNRAQYTSIFADEDYKSALQYADAHQRGIYEAEAKAIDEIQKGILAISQKEEPFDVFICYKETDNNGRRTPDSVLANDLYHQLTQEGFKVFFARITLEDKLGSAYEPYIFAALNSAKVMVVLGTKPEHFNAVWVKNEWSRYLALIRQGQKKMLIPAYKDMDPYDLPEEFSHLQAQDMSKLGFMQDLIRGIKKILDTDAPKPAKETVIVQESGGGQATAQIKRGNMALEDGDWAKADEFFEAALNLDAECAEAYMGKLLAQEKKKTLESYFESVSAGLTAQPEKATAGQPDSERIEKAVSQYTLSGYLKAEEIRNIYQFGLTYPVYCPGLSRARNAVKVNLQNDKFFSRARRFAKGEYKTRLDKAYDACLKAMDAIVEQARKDDEEAKRAKLAEYSAYLDDADQRAADHRAWAEGRQEKDYQAACRKQAEARISSDAQQAKEYFLALKNYKDAAERAKQCEDLMKKLNAESEKAERKRKARNQIITITSVSVIAVVVAVVLLVTQVILPANARRSAYNKAEALLAEGKAAEAAIQFGKAIGYQDAKERSFALWEDIAVRDTLSAGFRHTVGLKADGTVVAVGANNAKQCNVSDWTDIVAIATGEFHTVGLKADGTVVAVGDKDLGRCNVSDWADIVAIAAGSSQSVGLRADGTVVAVGGMADGSITGWTDIVAISAGEHYTVGLKSDGTVVAAGTNQYGQRNVSSWTDIVAIAAGDDHTVGLKADGTVVAVGENDDGECNVSGWTDIVAIAAGTSHTVGLKADGTVVAVGDNYYGECKVSGWTDVVAVAAGFGYTVGLKADGTIVATKYTVEDIRDYHGQCDVSDWTDIKLPKRG